jgi:small subunit ribosomal protein S2
MEKKKTEIISVKELIESGAHFGHTTTRWNPKMKPYLFGKQNGIHIINIKHTLKGLITAYYYLRELAKKNGLILFVGTKRQAQSVIKDEATRCNMAYVSERWLGGTLTNFDTIRLRLNKLIELEKMETDGTISRLNKKELSMRRR